MASARMLIALLMGLYAGLPLLLIGSTLQAWLKESGVSLRDIGFYTALAGLPYTLKFLWAPLLDRYVPPLGRRRGWLVLMQAALAASFFALAQLNPALSLPWVAFAALLISLFSATQDIAIDAYRREVMDDDELGFGSAMYVNGYRIGMLIAGAGGLALAQLQGFSWMYSLMAILMASAIIVTVLAPEPVTEAPAPRTLAEAVIAPLREYFQREGAVLTLVFIVLYKLGDTLAAALTTPFYLELGFSKLQIAEIVKLWGFWATILGGTLGGALILRIGITRALVWFGVGQMLSTAGFVWLAHAGNSAATLAAVVAFENFTSGMGTAAFVGFMAALTDRRFTATQYALLSSLMGVPRVILAAPSGVLVEWMGWSTYFIFCTLIALPGLWMATRATRWLSAPRAAAA